MLNMEQLEKLKNEMAENKVKMAKLEARNEELRAQVIAYIKELCEALSIQVGDLFPATGSKRAATRAPSVPPYKNSETGETWSGRGRMIKWLDQKIKEGHTLEDYKNPEYWEGREAKSAA